MESVKGIDYSEIVDELLEKDEEVISAALIGYTPEQITEIRNKAMETQSAMGGMADFAPISPGSYDPIIRACNKMLREAK